jgi:hypothetical protein
MLHLVSGKLFVIVGHGFSAGPESDTVLNLSDMKLNVTQLCSHVRMISVFPLPVKLFYFFVYSFRDALCCCCCCCCCCDVSVVGSRMRPVYSHYPSTDCIRDCQIITPKVIVVSSHSLSSDRFAKRQFSRFVCGKCLVQIPAVLEAVTTKHPCTPRKCLDFTLLKPRILSPRCLSSHQLPKQLMLCTLPRCHQQYRH